MKVPGGLTGERALALAGVGGLLAVLLACVIMVARALEGDEPELPVAAVTPQSTPKPTPTPKPKPTPVPLTAEQRVARGTAAQIVVSNGYEVVRLRDWDPRRTLRVLIGRQGTPPRRKAFFFVRQRYIGNDAGEGSARLKVRRQRDAQITLAYGTYREGDAACCPKGKPVNVRFRWDGAVLSPLDTLPPAQQRSPEYQLQ